MMYELYKEGIVKSSNFKISSNIDIDKKRIIAINSTRRADGGFPSGYAARFWTYMRTLSEFGFVYAQYNEPLKLSKIAISFIKDEIDAQEAFSIQAIKYNRRNPYRNVKNDFNYFRFILKILLKRKKISYEQFIISLFSTDGNVDEFLKTIENNKFKNYEETYKYLVKNFKKKDFAVNKFKTVIQDYPDVVIRLLIISGFITIRYLGKKFILINENKINYIKDLLSINFKLSEDEKINPKKYFKKLDSNNEEFLNIIKKYREKDVIDEKEYSKHIKNIIDMHKLNVKIIMECIKSINTKRVIIEEFREIPAPLKLEFFITILLYLIYGEDFSIKPNYKADHLGKPYSHAPANKGDIEVFSKRKKDLYWLIEVTLITNKNQQINSETTTVLRHLKESEGFKKFLKKYLSFVAPYVHEDTKNWYNYLISFYKKENIFIKPYDLMDFLKITVNKLNFIDMEQYTKKIN